MCDHLSLEQFQGSKEEGAFYQSNWTERDSGTCEHIRQRTSWQSHIDKGNPFTSGILTSTALRQVECVK